MTTIGPAPKSKQQKVSVSSKTVGMTKQEIIENRAKWALPKSESKVYQLLSDKRKTYAKDLNSNFSGTLVVLIREVYFITDRPPNAAVCWAMIRIKTWIDLNKEEWSDSRSLTDKVIHLLRELDV